MQTSTGGRYRGVFVPWDAVEWTQADGESVVLTSMSDKHLRNTLRRLLRTQDSLPSDAQPEALLCWIGVFKAACRARFGAEADSQLTLIFASRRQPEGARGEARTVFSAYGLQRSLHDTLGRMAGDIQDVTEDDDDAEAADAAYDAAHEHGWGW